MSLIKVLLGIAACAFSCASWFTFFDDVWDWEDLSIGFLIFYIASTAAVWWATKYVWVGFGIITLVIAVFVMILLLAAEEYTFLHFTYTLIVAIILVVTIISVITTDKNIKWDMDNYETQVVEYPIMGTSGDQIVIKVTDDGSSSLKPISMSSLKWQEEEVLVPYVYYETYTYTKYDYNKEPPEVLEKGRKKGSGYILCGSEKQIQDLFGYESKFNFEQ